MILLPPTRMQVREGVEQPNYCNLPCVCWRSQSCGSAANGLGGFFLVGSRHLGRKCIDNDGLIIRINQSMKHTAARSACLTFGDLMTGYSYLP